MSPAVAIVLRFSELVGVMSVRCFGGGLFSLSSRALAALCNALIATFRSVVSLLLGVTLANRQVFCSRRLVICSSSRLVASMS